MNQLRQKLKSVPRKVLAGLAFLYLAGLGWLVAIIAPFTDMPNKHLVFIVALCIAEASFLVAVGLLGKAYYRQLKANLVNRLRPPRG